jgi:hypothetical protein
VSILRELMLALLTAFERRGLLTMSQPPATRLLIAVSAAANDA